MGNGIVDTLYFYAMAASAFLFLILVLGVGLGIVLGKLLWSELGYSPQRKKATSRPAGRFFPESAARGSTR